MQRKKPTSTFKFSDPDVAMAVMNNKFPDFSQKTRWKRKAEGGSSSSSGTLSAGREPSSNHDLPVDLQIAMLGVNKKDRQARKQKEAEEETEKLKKAEWKAPSRSSSFTILESPPSSEENKQSLAEEKYTWSAAQQKVVSLVQQGQNVFFTGAAGSGKSCLMRYIIRLLTSDPERKVRQLAPTGPAALLIHGATIDSYFGLPIMELQKNNIEVILDRSKKNASIRKRWLEITTMVIDESSMINAVTIRQLDQVAKHIRGSKAHLPFAGIQVVMCGDFFQLAPVDLDKGYCFETTIFNEWFPKENQVMLTEVKRQKDVEFIKFLSSIRYAQVTPQVVETLTAMTKATKKRLATQSPSDMPVRICTHVAQVTKFNEEQFQRLPKSPSYCYKPVYKPHTITPKNFQVPKKNSAKQVPVTRNFMSRDLVKSKEQLLSEVKRECPLGKEILENGLELRIGTRVMIPVNIDISLGLVNGARGVVTGFSAEGPLKKTPLPIVKFDNGLTCLIRPYTWYSQSRYLVVELKQLPLIHAWAMTVHKAQGQTFDAADIDVAKAFAPGQVYVAMTRVREQKNLGIVSWNPKKIQGDPKILEFYMSLRRPK